MKLHRKGKRLCAVLSSLALLLGAGVSGGMLGAAGGTEPPASLRETFDNVDTLADTGFTADAAFSPALVTEGAISGKSLRLTANHTETEDKAWKDLLKISNFTFQPNTTYTVRLQYKELTGAKIGQMQFSLGDQFYFRVAPESNEITQAGNAAISATSMGSWGEVQTLEFMVVTDENSRTLNFCPIEWWAGGGKIDLLIDNVEIFQGAAPYSENFENADDMDDVKVTGANNTVVTESDGNKAMQYTMETGKAEAWSAIVTTEGTPLKFYKGVTYTVQLTLKTPVRSGSIQLNLVNDSKNQWLRIGMDKVNVWQGDKDTFFSNIDWSVSAVGYNAYRLQFVFTPGSVCDFKLAPCDWFDVPFLVDDIVIKSGASAPLVRQVYEDFEEAAQIYDGTAFWEGVGNDAGQNRHYSFVTGDAAISGERSYRVQMAAASAGENNDWVNLLALRGSDAFYGLNKGQAYTVRFSYKDSSDLGRLEFQLDNQIDSLIFDAKTLQKIVCWNDSIQMSGYKDAGGVCHVQFTFTIPADKDSIFIIRTGSTGDNQTGAYTHTGAVDILLDDVQLLEGIAPELTDPTPPPPPVTVVKEVVENFEDAASLDDTVFGSAGVASLVSEGALSGGKSLKVVVNGADTDGFTWKQLVRTLENKLQLEAGTSYTVEFLYKVTEGSIPLMMFSAETGAGANTYVQWNMPDGNVHYQSPAADADPTIKYTSEKLGNGVMKATFVFTPSASDKQLVIANGDFNNPAQDTPFTVLFDNISIRKTAGSEVDPPAPPTPSGPVGEVEEGFENASSVNDTVFRTDVEGSIVSAGALSGNKSLQAKVAGDELTWRRLLFSDKDALVLEAGTAYTFQFTYKLSAGSIPLMMFTTNDGAGQDNLVVQWNLPAGNIHWQNPAADAAGAVKMSTISLPDGSTRVQFVFTAGEKDKQLVIQNGDFNNSAQDTPFTVLFDDVVLKKGASDDLVQPPDTSYQPPIQEGFENVSNLFEDTPFWSEAKVQSIVTENAINGKKSLLIENDPANWLTILGLSMDEYKLRANTKYELQFFYEELSDLNAIQCVIKSAEGDMWIRWDATNLSIIGGDDPLKIDFRGRTMIGGEKRITLTFTTGPADSYFVLGGGCEGQEEDNKPIKLLIDDVSIKNLNPANNPGTGDAGLLLPVAGLAAAGVAALWLTRKRKDK